MPKPRTGTLEWRKRGWAVRLTVDVDGESIRKWFDLGTEDKQVAKRKAARLSKHHGQSPAAIVEAAKTLETYVEASERIREKRRGEGVKNVRNEDTIDKLYIVPAIGQMDVRDVRPGHINTLLDGAATAGKSQETLKHIRAALNNVFDNLWRAELIPENPVARVRVPKGKRDRRERAVLTDLELVVYLAWSHSDERHQHAVLERQTMSIVARCFGGLRTGDLHALRWDALETTNGAFTFGWAPRKKTSRPQKLSIPPMMRPILHDWWTRHGQPTVGLVFPSLRGSMAGVGEKQGVSHAGAFRRDLKRAFTAALEANPKASVPKKGSPRWNELFEQTSHTKPVDFHSWRRAFNQALADAEVNAQTASALAGHADLGAHMRYLTNTSKMRTIPEAALPVITVSSDTRTIQETIEPTSTAEPTEPTEDSGAGRGTRTLDLQHGNALSDANPAKIVESPLQLLPHHGVEISALPSSRTIRADDSKSLLPLSLVREFVIIASTLRRFSSLRRERP